MVALPAAGCGLGTSSVAPAPSTVAGPKEVIWSHYFGPADARTAPLEATFQAAEQATGVKITAIGEPGPDYWPKRQAEHAAGSTNVDIIANQTNWVLPGGLSGMFVDHFEPMRRDKVDPKSYYKAELDSWTWKGKLWAVPYQSGGELVLYNKKLFDARNVAYPRKDWTYDDLLEICRKLNDPASGKFALWVVANGINQMMGTFILNHGGKLLNPERTKALYGNDANAIRGTEVDVDLHLKHRVTPTPEALQAIPSGGTPTESELVAMEINHPFRRPNVARAIGAEHLDYAPPPKGPSGLQTAVMWGNSWSILAGSKAREAAWQVLKWTQSKEGVLGPQLDVVSWPSQVWAANSPQWQERFKGTHIADVTKVWETSGRDILVLPEGNDAWTTMNAPTSRALRGEIAPREALQESANALDDLFGRRPAAWQ